MSKVRRRAVVAGLLAGVVASGCTVPGTSPPAPAASVDAAIAPGGTITVAITAPGSLDPVSATSPSAQLVSSLLCETLLTIDPVDGSLRPGLVESWAVSDGGSSIQLKLNRKAMFHDGAAVDSRAVVNSIRRMVSPETASPMAELLAQLGGYEEYRRSVEDGDETVTLLRGARVIEPWSLEIILSKKDPDFVRTLAHRATAPVRASAAAADPIAFARSPVCAGPYELEEPVAPDAAEIRLRRRAAYSNKAAGYTRGGAGWAERIVFKVVPDEGAAYAAWTRGEVDIAGVPSDKLPEARARYGDAVVSARSGQVEYIGLPYGAQSAFNGDEIRQALAAAIDRRRIATEVYGGSRAPATGFIPPIAGKAHRPDACRFVAPSSPPDLPEQPVRFYFNDEFNHRRLAQAVADQWKEALGLTVELVPMNWDEYLQRATLAAGFDGAFRVSWTPKTNAAVDYIRPLFHSSFTGSTNWQGFADSEVDEALDLDVAKATDEGDRILLLQKIEDDLCRRLPLIPIVFSESHVVVQKERLMSARRDGSILGADGMVMLRELALRPTS